MMENNKDSLAYVLAYVITWIALEWLMNCAFLWLASKCFDVEFSLKTATGIWALLHSVKMVFHKTKEV